MGLFLFAFIILGFFISVRLLLYRTTLIHRLKKLSHWIEDRLHEHQTLKVPELDENNHENQFYRKVYTYLNSLPTIEDSDDTNLISGTNPTSVALRLDHNQTVVDSFLGARLSWTLKTELTESKLGYQKKIELKIKKKDKRRILQSYIQHIYRAAEDAETREPRQLKLFYMNTVPVAVTATTNTTDCRTKIRWSAVRLTHPATFETIAMDSDLKKKVKSDLETFVKSKLYYHRLGRVWKRSYLLYGPSGTGKSSFIAAMAKFLQYDIYEIDINKVVDDSDLKSLLLQTRSKSVIVVEDLDRFLTSKSAMLTTSGLLNFMDGLLTSCCGDEKLMVFTMYSKDKIDSAILRPGRIDVHIHFPLCDFTLFKELADNYLGLKTHKLFTEVEHILNGGATMSPAEMSELMIANRGSPGRALRSVITALQISGDARVSSAVKTNGVMTEGDVYVMEGGSCNVPVVKEIQKLYGLIRMKSSKKIGPSDQFSGSMERSR